MELNLESLLLFFFFLVVVVALGADSGVEAFPLAGLAASASLGRGQGARVSSRPFLRSSGAFRAPHTIKGTAPGRREPQ